MTATGALSRDLVQATELLLGNEAPDLRSMIAALAVKTADAERRLGEATKQAQELRAELSILRRDVHRDHLTGLVNRFGLEEHLQALAESSFCLAMIDVDHFKQVNDSHGHAVGDRVLKLVAATLTKICTPHLAGRWGGEEFIVVFESDDLKSNIASVDQARAALAAKRLRVRDSDQSLGTISFSAGVVASGGRAVEAILEAADVLLYEAKHRGRNVVIGEA
jgi:diguanylate cyclase